MNCETCRYSGYGWHENECSRPTTECSYQPIEQPKPETKEVKKENRMSRLDQDREDLIRLIISICDYARLGYEVSTYNNCNNCRRKECQFKPDCGNAVRWNCPLWKEGD